MSNKKQSSLTIGNLTFIGNSIIPVNGNWSIETGSDEVIVYCGGNIDKVTVITCGSLEEALRTTQGIDKLTKQQD